MTRADSAYRGEIHPPADAVRGVAICCIEPPRSRIAPTPTPVARAAARACRRVRPRVAVRGLAICSSAGARLTGPLNPRARVVALAGCEQFVSGRGDQQADVAPLRQAYESAARV